MDQTINEKRIGDFFRVSVFIKGLISLIEIIAGVLAFFIPASTVTAFLIDLAQSELTENPTDFIASHILPILQQLSLASGIFIAVYLLSRGLIKFLLVVALLKNQLWAYPSSLLVLAGFILYQVYDIVHKPSIFLTVLTIFDLIIMLLIWKEYAIVKRHRAAS